MSSTQHRIFDWRFVASLTVMVLVVTLCWSVVKRINQTDDLVSIAAASATQVQTLNERAVQDRKAAAFRQAQLVEQNRVLRVQLGTVVRVLRRNGLNVPKTLLTLPVAHSGKITRPLVRPEKGHGPKPRHPKPTTHPSPHPTPAPPLVDPGMLCGLVPMLGCPVPLP